MLTVSQETRYTAFLINISEVLNRRSELLRGMSVTTSLGQLWHSDQSICDNQNNLSRVELNYLFTTSPLFSGDLRYPVPSTDHTLTSQYIFSISFNKYYGSYGMLRLMMLTDLHNRVKIALQTKTPICENLL